MNRENIDALDGLRGLACLFVVFSHAGRTPIFPPIAGAGQLGVTLFFCLSGFLMAYLYGRDTQKVRWGDYALKRIFRVYPAYLAVIVASYFAYEANSKFPYKMTLQELKDHLVLMGDLSVFWTIPVEMRFYAVFPFLAILLGWVNTGAKRMLVLVAFVSMFIIMNPLGPKVTVWPKIEFFLVGCLAGYAFLNRMMLWNTAFWDGLFLLGLAVMIVLIPAFSLPLLGFKLTAWANPTLFASLMGLIVFSCARSTGLVRVVLSSKIARFVGRISFSLYLIHYPMLNLVIRYTRLDSELKMVVYLASSIFVAYVLCVAVEDTGRKLGRMLSEGSRRILAPA